MRFTKETFIRMLKTFVQAVAAYALVEIKAGVDLGNKEVLKGFVIGLIAAGLAAVMNLKKPEECGSGTGMSVDLFIEKYLGKSTDYDGVYGTQCVDLAKLYIDRVMGVTPRSIGNAHCYFDDFENTYLKKYFKKIPYKKGVKSRKGDLVVWGKYYNGVSECGHIALASGEQNEYSITTYDQNWNGKEMKKVIHPVSGVAGFLRPLNSIPVYFKKCKKGFVSIADALESIGENKDYTYRKRIAAVNGIKAYKGTPAQNLKMLKLLKKGRLIKP